MKATKKTVSAFCHFCDYGVCNRKRCKGYKWNTAHSFHRERDKVKKDIYKEISRYYEK